MNRTSLPAPEQRNTPGTVNSFFHCKNISPHSTICTRLSAHTGTRKRNLRAFSPGAAPYQIQLQHYATLPRAISLFIPPALLHAITVTPRETLCTETYVFHMIFGASTADICSVQYLTPLATAKLIPPFFFDTRHPLHDALDDLFNDMDALHDDAAQGYELLLKADFLRLDC